LRVTYAYSVEIGEIPSKVVASPSATQDVESGHDTDANAPGAVGDIRGSK